MTLGRGKRLKHAEAYAYARKCGDRKSYYERQKALFDGSVYGGRSAVAFGLADGVYTEMSASLKTRFGDDVKIRELKPKVGLMEKLQALQEANAAAYAVALVRTAGGELTRVATEAEQGPHSLR